MKMLAIISHRMMKQQIDEAKEILKVDSIIELPQEFKNIWGNIEPKGPLPIELLKRMINWIDSNSSSGDYVLVQGDFGATYYIVDYCFKSDRIPIYATTKRETNEMLENGAVIVSRIFKHINFRNYQKY